MRAQSISEQVFNHALAHVSQYSSEGGHTWVVVPTGPLAHQAWPIASSQFRSWLASSFQAEHGVFPGDHAVRHAVTVFQARARFAPQPAEQDAFTRIGWRGDPLRPEALTIDLATSTREVVEITRSGWNVTTNDGWRFRTTPTSRPLPRPCSQTPGLLDSLAPLLNNPPTPTLHRLAVWLFAAMRPTGPYPILILGGPPSSGKSMTARILRSLIDPAAAPLNTLPGSEHELFVLAFHNRVLVFDHVPSLTNHLSVAFARLATGTAFTLQSQNPLDAPLPLAVARPIILTVPSTEAAATHWSRNHTLSSLAITAQFEAIEPQRLLSYHDIADRFAAASPSILAALCTAASAALANIAETTVPSPSRFVDAHLWTASAASALGLSIEDVNAALHATPFIRALKEILGEWGEWSGTATDLLATFRDVPGLPTNTKALTQALAATPLAVFGIQYSVVRKNNERRIALRVTDAAKNPSLLTQTSVPT
jgi:putative DNA primase/helicase